MARTGKMEENRTNRLQRADVWKEEITMECECECGIRVGEYGSSLIIWEFHQETPPIMVCSHS